MGSEALLDALVGHFGDDAEPAVSFGALTVTVPPDRWTEALLLARDGLGCDFFDWLTAVDQEDEGFAVFCHVYSVAEHHHLLTRTVLPRERPRLASAVEVFRGAAWHERETFEMFGIVFDGHPRLLPLLLPDGFEGHPLRKDFVLAARAAKAWPGAPEPGESAADAAAPGRRPRRPRPLGTPDPAWGPRPDENDGADDEGIGAP